MIKGRPKDIVKVDSPGPGKYEPSTAQVKDKVVSFKIGSTKR
jgi:hypothetical protein